MLNEEVIKKDAHKMFVYFSQLMDRYVFDANNKFVGKIYDIVLKPSEVYPQSWLLVIRKGFINRLYAVVPWSEIVDIDAKDARLKIDASKIEFSEKRNNKGELTLRRDIL